MHAQACKACRSAQACWRRSVDAVEARQTSSTRFIRHASNVANAKAEVAADGDVVSAVQLQNLPSSTQTLLLKFERNDIRMYDDFELQLIYYGRSLQPQAICSAHQSCSILHKVASPTNNWQNESQTKVQPFNNETLYTPESISIQTPTLYPKTNQKANNHNLLPLRSSSPSSSSLSSLNPSSKSRLNLPSLHKLSTLPPLTSLS